MNASPPPASTDDEMTRTYRAFQAAQRRYFARPNLRRCRLIFLPLGSGPRSTKAQATVAGNGEARATAMDTAWFARTAGHIEHIASLTK